MKSLNNHFDRIQKNKEVLERVENCIENNAELNDWEDDFLESFQTQLIEGKLPSTAQMEKFEQIEYTVEWGREAYWDEFGNNV